MPAAVLKVNSKQCAMLFELLSKAIAAGPDAEVLGSLYRNVAALNATLNPPTQKSGGNAGGT